MSSSTDVVTALDVALRVAAVLEDIGCEYFVGGSVASSLQGEPRATNDIDLVVAMMPHRVREFAEKLGSDFEVDQDMPHHDIDARPASVARIDMIGSYPAYAPRKRPKLCECALP